MFDHVSDLHLDNALSGGPHGWLGQIDMGRYKKSQSRFLIVAGDTSEYLSDTIDALNGVAQHYQHVVAVLGNHEKPGDVTLDDLRENVTILDLIGGETVIDGIGFVGGSLDWPEDVQRAVSSYRGLVDRRGVDRIIAVSHFAPTPRLGETYGRDIRLKSNNLLDLIGKPGKRTDIVFGHLHLGFEGELDGFQLHANPRGYRGLRRDRSSWRGRFETFA